MNDPTSQNNMRRTAATSMVWTVGDRVGAEAVSMLVFMVLARLLDPSMFGLIALARVFTSLAMLGMQQGLDSAIVQRSDLTSAHKHTAFWANLALGLLASGLTVVMAGTIAHWLGDPMVAPLLKWLSLGFLIEALTSLPGALLRRELRFRALAIRAWISVVLGGSVGVWMAWSGYGVWSLVAMELVRAGVGVPLLWLAARYWPALCFSRQCLKDLLNFGAMVFGLKLVYFGNTQLDRLFVGALIGPAALGFYAIAQRLPQTIGRVLAMTVMSVAFPAFSRIKDDQPRMIRSLEKALTMVASLTTPAYVGLAVLAPEAVDLVFGPGWSQAVLPLQVLALVGVTNSLTQVTSPVVMAVGRPGTLLSIAVVGAVMQLVLVLVLWPWGIAAVAMAHVGRWVVTFPMHLWVIRRHLAMDLTRFWRCSLAPLVASAVAAGVTLLVLQEISAERVAVRLAVGLVTGAGAYLSILLGMDRRALREILQTLSVMRPIKSSPPGQVRR